MKAKSIIPSTQQVMILVHGAWFGSFAWTKVKAILEDKGYQVFAPDLPGYGKEATPFADIGMEDYVKTVVDTANSFEEQAMLIGHSMAGAVITQASEILGPKKVSKLVFLDAFWLQNGESIISQVADINKATIESGHSDNRKYESDYLVFSEDGRFVSVDKERMVEVFCHDSPLEDKNRFNVQEVWQPVSVLTTPVNVTDSRYGAIPKFYINCTESRDLDRSSILPRLSCKKIYSLSSSHSPFFSMPDKLTDLLVEIYHTDN